MVYENSYENFDLSASYLPVHLPASRAPAPAAGRRLLAERASSTSSTGHVTILGVAQGADHRARRLAVALTVEVSAAAEHDALPQRDAHG